MTISNQAELLTTFLHTIARNRSFFGTQTFHSTYTHFTMPNFKISSLICFSLVSDKTFCVRIWENGMRHLLYEMQIKIEFLWQFVSCEICVQKFHFGCEIWCHRVARSNGLCFSLCSAAERTDLDVIQSKWFSFGCVQIDKCVLRSDLLETHQALINWALTLSLWPIAAMQLHK